MERRYISDYFRLIRWENLLFLGILIWVLEKWVCAPVLVAGGFYEVLPWWFMALLIGASVCIAAGGYVINDYFDIKIDRINRADKLIVTQTVSKDQAMVLYRIMTCVGIGLGLVASWIVRSWPMTVIFIFVPGLLWFYSSAYKRQLFLGNLIIALTSALPPFLVALANIGWLNHHFAIIMPYLSLSRDLIYWMSGFSLFAFLMTWIREIVKDLQDQAGDREFECHTLPIVLGELWTKIILTALILITAGLLSYCCFTVLPFPHSWDSLSTRYLVFGLLVPLACEIVLLWAAKIASDYRHAQLLMKFIMFIGVLFAFVIARTL